MAKAYTRRRGKAGSKKPLLATVPTWVQYKPGEVEALVAKLAKQGLSTSLIGITLRDSYGVPDVETITKKKIGKILEELGLVQQLPEDIQNLIKKALAVKKHMQTHKKDMHSKRGLQVIEAKISRLARYYKRTGKLPAKWKAEIEVV